MVRRWYYICSNVGCVTEGLEGSAEGYIEEFSGGETPEPSYCPFCGEELGEVRREDVET